MKKYYNVELPRKNADRLKELCKKLEVKFETSAVFDQVHFEIELVKNSLEYNAINDFLQKGSV